MCRHVAYAGDPVPLSSVLFEPEHSLERQSWAPRRQSHGTVNADGVGVGWYAPGRAEPARYRRSGPIWADESLREIAPAVRAGCLLAAVRSATPGMPAGAEAVAPLRDRTRLFSLNGAFPAWPGAAAGLVARLAEQDLASLDGLFDAALAWALVRSRLAGGASLAGALEGAAGDLARAGLGGRCNMLAADGVQVAATVSGETLSYRLGEAGVLVASEPLDAGPDWEDVPDGSVVLAMREEVRVRPLEH